MKNPFEEQLKKHVNGNKKLSKNFEKSNISIGVDDHFLKNSNSVFENLSPEKVLQRHVKFNNNELVFEKINNLSNYKQELEESLEKASCFDPIIDNNIIESLKKDLENYQEESPLWQNAFEELQEKQTQKYAYEELDLTHKELERISEEISMLHEKYEVWENKEKNQKPYLN